MSELSDKVSAVRKQKQLENSDQHNRGSGVFIPSSVSDLSFALEVDSLYDTPKSTRPNSIVVDGYYDSPRSSLKLIYEFQSNSICFRASTSFYDVPRPGQVIVGQELYDTPPSSRAVSTVETPSLTPESPTSPSKTGDKSE